MQTIAELEGKIAALKARAEGTKPRVVGWTYVTIDWDLLRDDIDAADNFPNVIWETEEEALQVANEEHRESWWPDDDPSTYQPLKWEKWRTDADHYWMALDNGGEIEWRVYSMTLQAQAPLIKKGEGGDK